jgi:hypothetical protein
MHIRVVERNQSSRSVRVLREPQSLRTLTELKSIPHKRIRWCHDAGHMLSLFEEPESSRHGRRKKDPLSRMFQCRLSSGPGRRRWAGGCQTRCGRARTISSTQTCHACCPKSCSGNARRCTTSHRGGCTGHCQTANCQSGNCSPRSGETRNSGGCSAHKSSPATAREKPLAPIK